MPVETRNGNQVRVFCFVDVSLASRRRLGWAIFRGVAMRRLCGPALVLSSWSASSAAQLASSGSLPLKYFDHVSDLPSILDRRASPTLRLRPDGRWLGVRATPFLDSAVTDREGASRSMRRRGYRFDLGAVELGVEAQRSQVRATDLLELRSDKTRTRKSWATGFTAEWALGSNDRLSLGLASGSYRNPQPAAVETDPRAATSLQRLALSWARGDQWRLGIAWQRNGGSARGESDRMVEIANGAPLHEQGMGLSVSFLPGGADDPHQTAIGVEARRAVVAATDVTVIGSGLRRNMQETLYLRRQF